MHSSETRRRLRQLAQNATELANLLEPREGHGPNVEAIGKHEEAVQRDIGLVREACEWKGTP